MYGESFQGIIFQIKETSWVFPIFTALMSYHLFSIGWFTWPLWPGKRDSPWVTGNGEEALTALEGMLLCVGGVQKGGGECCVLGQKHNCLGTRTGSEQHRALPQLAVGPWRKVTLPVLCFPHLKTKEVRLGKIPAYGLSVKAWSPVWQC